MVGIEKPGPMWKGLFYKEKEPTRREAESHKRKDEGTETVKKLGRRRKR